MLISSNSVHVVVVKPGPNIAEEVYTYDDPRALWYASRAFGQALWVSIPAMISRLIHE